MLSKLVTPKVLQERRGRVGRCRGGCRTQGWRRRRSGEAPPLDGVRLRARRRGGGESDERGVLDVLPEVEQRGKHGLGRALGRVGHGHLQDAAFPVAGTGGTVVDPGVDGPLAGEVDATGGVVPEVGGGGGDHGAEIWADVIPVSVAELDVQERVELYRGDVGGSGRGGAALRGLSSSLASATTPRAKRCASGQSEQQRELCLASLMTSP